MTSQRFVQPVERGGAAYRAWWTSGERYSPCPAPTLATTTGRVCGAAGRPPRPPPSPPAANEATVESRGEVGGEAGGGRRRAFEAGGDGGGGDGQIPLQPQNAVQKHPFAAERLPPQCQCLMRAWAPWPYSSRSRPSDLHSAAKQWRIAGLPISRRAGDHAFANAAPGPHSTLRHLHGASLGQPKAGSVRLRRRPPRRPRH